MNPSREIIFFTTASGAGYGIIVLLGFLALFDALPAHSAFGGCALLVAFILVSAGLLSSTLHLGHPERMLLAFSQWRTSWLSREAIFALLTYIPSTFFALGWLGLGHYQGIWTDIAVLAALLALATVFCTAMIYASLKAIPFWHSAWVPANYLILSVMTGAILLYVIAVIFNSGEALVARIALLALLAGGVSKSIYWMTIRTKVVSQIGTATQLGHIGKVRALEPPHTNPNFLQKEMGFRVASKAASRLRGFALFWGFFLPFILVLIGRDTSSPAWAIVLALVTLLSTGVGIAAERWLFFAEAKHQSSLYYGESSV